MVAHARFRFGRADLCSGGAHAQRRARDPARDRRPPGGPLHQGRQREVRRMSEPILCAVCRREPRGFGWFDARFRPADPRRGASYRRLCSRACQDICHRRQGMIDPTPNEHAAMVAGGESNAGLAHIVRDAVCPRDIGANAMIRVIAVQLASSRPGAAWRGGRRGAGAVRKCARDKSRRVCGHEAVVFSAGFAPCRTRSECSSGDKPLILLVSRARRSRARQQCSRASNAGHRDEAFIVPPFFKCLETWRVGSRDQSDTGGLFVSVRC